MTETTDPMAAMVHQMLSQMPDEALYPLREIVDEEIERRAAAHEEEE